VDQRRAVSSGYRHDVAGNLWAHGENGRSNVWKASEPIVRNERHTRTVTLKVSAGLVTICLVALGASACSNGVGQHTAETNTTFRRAPTKTPTPTSRPVIATATAMQVATGHWSTIAAAPIAPRDEAAVAWTGHELIVWGGQTQQTAQTNPMIDADGAAYNPTTHRWRRLPAAPIAGREDAVAVWTGAELIIWGGSDAEQLAEMNSQSPLPRPPTESDAVAYHPATNTWQRIGTVPLATSLGATTEGVWTGDRVVLMSGLSSASYDPATGAWRPLPPAYAPQRLPGYTIDENGWSLAVAAGPGQVFAWSEWQATKAITAQDSQGAGGSDLFRYDESSNRWSVVTSWSNAIPEPQAAFWTGTRLLVRGDQHIPGALGPGPIPEDSRWYNPMTGITQRLPPDALAANDVPASNLSSAWTGDALWSLNALGQAGPIKPGDASVFDATRNTWRRLQSAPFGCATAVTPEWTGGGVLVYCSTPHPAQISAVGGLEYSIG